MAISRKVSIILPSLKPETMFKKSLFPRKLIFFMLLITLVSFTQADKPVYRIFTASGAGITYSQMLDSLRSADVIFFGELHNNAISHWLQMELTSDLYQLDSAALILGAEMFESDNQLMLDEYIDGVIRERDFEAAARLWNNYKTDYKPLVTFAATNRIPFIASNIPRRYAALVNNRGFEALEALSPEAKSYIAPLPIPYDPELPGYKAMTAMGGPSMKNNDNLPKAQAIKDATMAWFIAEAWKPGSTFLHFNGRYHSDDREGIVWYLNQYKPGIKIMTITTVEQDQLDSPDEEEIGAADFILVVNSKVTKTY
jgi:uncharacterized iron-regulated protein